MNATCKLCLIEDVLLDLSCRFIVYAIIMANQVGRDYGYTMLALHKRK